MNEYNFTNSVKEILNIIYSGNISISDFNRDEYLFCVFFIIEKTISNSKNIRGKISYDYNGIFYNFDTTHEISVKRKILNFERFATISIL